MRSANEIRISKNKGDAPPDVNVAWGRRDFDWGIGVGRLFLGWKGEGEMRDRALSLGPEPSVGRAGGTGRAAP